MNETEIKNALVKYGISNVNFEHAIAALNRLCERSGASAEEVLEIIKENEQLRASPVADEIDKIRKCIVENESKINVLEQMLGEVQKKAEWMLNVPSKEEIGTVVEKISSNIHEKIVGIYCTWKISSIEETMREIQEENTKLIDEEITLSQICKIINDFENMINNPEYGNTAEKHGAKLILKSFLSTH